MDILDPAVSDYLLTHCTPADEVLRDLAEETRAALPAVSGMQISHDEGEFLTMLVRLSGARNAVEIGVFTGYSSICIARGLPDDGHLLALDISDEWTSVARRYWERAGVSDKIELKLGPALDSVRALPDDEVVDFVFIDADKTGYAAYYEGMLPRLRSGGVIVFDNVLQSGRVTDPKADDDNTLAIKALNDALVTDPRVTSVMLPVRDGVTIVRKR